jgi:hypothetical protein
VNAVYDLAKSCRIFVDGVSYTFYIDISPVKTRVKLVQRTFLIRFRSKAHRVAPMIVLRIVDGI